jgi:predicted nuclease of restriction endonuclease-like (RecB) superfamily
VGTSWSAERPVDLIKQPYVLDFLDLPDAHQLRESDLESAILEKLQHFLLELGKGFAFVGRQKSANGNSSANDEC